MLYTKQQVETMLKTARTTNESFEDIIDEMDPVYLIDEDSINDAGYDEVGPDDMEIFKQGGEWVNGIMRARINRADESLNYV